jgi:hypothetical protein
VRIIETLEEEPVSTCGVLDGNRDGVVDPIDIPFTFQGLFAPLS